MKTVVVALPTDEYRRLADRAQANDRDPWQEARNIVRQAIAAPAATFNSPVGPGEVFPPLPSPTTGPKEHQNG
ncbi:MAG TPA: hypothetical protein VIU62_22240 [Chloroflexota bacterium]|jgi:hypothetical protein